ncbi:hypothetical protein QP420_06120 [Bifidobacterium sp. UMB1197]|nr:hypothetical protein [Bifidobacterium sp. UMB1197]
MCPEKGVHIINHVQKAEWVDGFCTIFDLNHVQKAENSSVFCSDLRRVEQQTRENLPHFVVLIGVLKSSEIAKKYPAKTLETKGLGGGGIYAV